MMPPPMKPSQVLFGDSFMKVLLISFFPSMKPLKYAPVSLNTTNKNGSVNQKSPESSVTRTSQQQTSKREDKIFLQLSIIKIIARIYCSTFRANCCSRSILNLPNCQIQIKLMNKNYSFQILKIIVNRIY